MNDKLRAFFGLIPAAMLAACSPGTAGSQGAAPPLAGARIGGDFTLTDQDGRRVSDDAFQGKFRIVYFGYTYCPDVCPVDVQNIAAALRLIKASDPALAAKLVALFISVDPERDTPPVLKQFVGAFGPPLVGLTGSPAEIKAVAEKFAIYYQKQPANAEGGYTLDHSRQAYLMDPDGKPLALLAQDAKPEALATEIKKWAQ